MQVQTIQRPSWVLASLKRLMTTFAGCLALGVLMGATAPSKKIGLKCSGLMKFPGIAAGSNSEEHYVIDRTRRLLIHRDNFTGEIISTYPLTVNARYYGGIRTEEGKTNGGVPVHHYETVSISREDGRIEQLLLSTTAFPNGPVTSEIRFNGQCVVESPNQLKAPKF